MILIGILLFVYLDSLTHLLIDLYSPDFLPFFFANSLQAHSSNSAQRYFPLSSGYHLVFPALFDYYDLPLSEY